MTAVIPPHVTSMEFVVPLEKVLRTLPARSAISDILKKTSTTRPNISVAESQESTIYNSFSR